MSSETRVLAGRDDTSGDDKNTKFVNNKKSHLKGKEEGLGSNVFSYGHVAQAEIYNRTVLEIAEYVGKKYCKEVLKREPRLLTKRPKMMIVVACTTF